MHFYLSFTEVWIVKPNILIVNYFSIIQKSPSGLFQTPPEYVRFKFVAHFRRRAVDENIEFSQSGGCFKSILESPNKRLNARRLSAQKRLTNNDFSIQVLLDGAGIFNPQQFTLK